MRVRAWRLQFLSMAAPRRSVFRSDFRRPLWVACGDGFGVPKFAVELDMQFGELAFGIPILYLEMLGAPFRFPKDRNARAAGGAEGAHRSREFDSGLERQGGAREALNGNSLVFRHQRHVFVRGGLASSTPSPSLFRRAAGGRT